MTKRRWILLLWLLLAYSGDGLFQIGRRRFPARLRVRHEQKCGLYCASGGDALPADGFSGRNELAFASDDDVLGIPTKKIGRSNSAGAPLGKRTAALANSGRRTSSSPNFENDNRDSNDDNGDQEEDGEIDEDSDGTEMVNSGLSKIYKSDEDEGDEWAFMEKKRTFDELTDNEYQRVMDLALDDEHKQTLGKKVEAVMEQEWDIQQGVTTSVKPQPVEANLDLASYHARQAMVKRGNFTEAAEIYQRCIEYNPVDGRAWLGLARIYQKRGFPIEAEKCYKDGLYYNPKNPFLLQSWAVMLEKQGKMAQAMKLLRTSVISNPKHSASWVALGQINVRKGRIDEARYCFRSAVEGDGKSYVALQAWGVLESKHGRLNDARALFKRALQQSRNSVHTLQAWATLERNQGNLRAAEKLLGRALKEWPKSTRSRVGLAEIRELRGEVEEARKTFELGEKFAARCGDAGFFQSWALLETRMARSELRDEEKEAWMSSKGEDFNEDKDEVERVSSPREQGRMVRTRPSREGGRQKFERIADGKASKIRGLYRRAIKVNKYHSASWIAWAKFEQQNGNPDVARRLLTEGVNNFPHSKNLAWFHTALGNLAWHRGDVTTARACYSRALDASAPQRSLSILLEYAKMEERLGSRKGTEARALYERAVAKFPREERVWSAYIDFERRKERLPIPNGGVAAAAAVAAATAAEPLRAADVDGVTRSTRKDAGSSSPISSSSEPAQVYNPGGAVNRLLMRRKEASSLARKPKLQLDTEWEENLEFGGI